VTQRRKDAMEGACCDTTLTDGRCQAFTEKLDRDRHCVPVTLGEITSQAERYQVTYSSSGMCNSWRSISRPRERVIRRI